MILIKNGTDSFIPVIQQKYFSTRVELQYIISEIHQSYGTEFSLVTVEIFNNNVWNEASSVSLYTHGPEATSTSYGMIKLNPSDSISTNSNGQLTVGGRLGQMEDTTGIYAPNTINPASINNGSFLLTEASGTRLGSKSLAVITGIPITLKTTATAGATEYIVANNYVNRIFAASAVGATAALDEASAATEYT